MIHAKNYETASTFVKVIQRNLSASFFPDTVYKGLSNATVPEQESVRQIVNASRHVMLV